ncbi:hypothetical protein [Steroidobacter cummioxidans]|uniref:hypothetical protein n=1 Tax=Steroidobacter cummioxidans TaxID=1803913 RepID=UPI0039C8FCB7
MRARARSQGFTERELHVVERGFDWQALLAKQQRQNCRCFAERKIIEIRNDQIRPRASRAPMPSSSWRPSRRPTTWC